jgi:two-component system sensor histidine kinase RegB
MLGPMSRIEHAGSAPHAAPALAADAPADATRVLMRWLVGLRWAVFAVLGAALPFEEAYLGYHVRYAVALPVLGAVVLVNAAQHRRIAGGAGSSRAVGLGVAFDLLAIGALLAASGGAANPFSVVFVVHVALAASMLPARTTFALAALAACLFGALFALPSGACCPNHPANGAFSTHLYGMWLAFVVAAGLVSYFLTRVRRALAEREREIAELRRRAEETARFAALGTLAAGTAHELGTPLGTIGVLAGEIADGAEPAARGAHAISVQVARCRDILARLAAGAEAARPRATAPLGETVRRAVAAWTRAHPEAEVEVDAGAPETAPAPLAAEDVEAALCVLLDNALQATSGGEVITVATRAEAGAVELAVEDRGAGVPSELRDRLGEPFVTTKEPGQGMGLGLYWIRTLLARCGGRLLVEPREPRGTRVVLRFAETTPR